MRKVIYISFLLLFFLADAKAQEKIIHRDSSLLQSNEEIAPSREQVILEPAPAGVADEENEEAEEPDTALYQRQVSLPYDSLQNWKARKEYAYTAYIDSLLKNRKKNELKSPPRSSGFGILNKILGSGIVQLLFWTVVIVFVLFIIYRLFLADGVFQRRSKTVKNGEAEVEEGLITQYSDFDALIRAALQNGKYRQAVRYQYLRTLHLLAGKNFIELAPDKTNFQYVREIKNPGLQQDFAALTLHYEYVWYGEFDIEKMIYQKIENNFNSLNQKL